MKFNSIIKKMDTNISNKVHFEENFPKSNRPKLRMSQSLDNQEDQDQNHLYHQSQMLLRWIPTWKITDRNKIYKIHTI